ncbi:MAG: pyridoxal phosphate-dependent aminotransferase [Treponema sp.]|nr:pyridoxal phosphate-dependent aminotransferase [Treponema sp.]
MISKKIRSILEDPSNGVIRKMFEEGAALKKKFGADNVFDFSIGNPDLEPPEEVVFAMNEVVADKTPLSHGYMPNAGYNEAREAMAKKTSLEQGVEISAEHVVMSVGAAGAMNCVFKSLLDDGDEVLVPSPYFAEYVHYVRNHGGVLHPVKTNSDFSLNIEEIKNALSKKTAAIIINSPNNPTGKIYSENDIQALSDALKEHGNKNGRMPYIICDEPYRAIAYNNKKVAAVFPVYENSVVVTSFAKNLSVPGERIGYIAVNPRSEDCNSLVSACILATRILGFVNAPAFFQKVIAKSWNAHCDYSLYEKRASEIKEVMDYAGLEYAEPEGAFYLFVKVPDAWNGDDMAFTEHLKKYNVLCAPGVGFGEKGWFRVSYCVSEKTILNSRKAFYDAVHSK